MSENNENSEREHPDPGELRDEITAEDFPSTPEEMGLELDDIPPESKVERKQSVRDEPDAILEENYDRCQPDLTDVMSGESSRLQDGSSRDWHEPRSLY
ncbi:hypothetical protein [Halococcus thailandensis]|jgi:hypothetical protein|uniref:Uncharacterized protein n=1 Tax=Halococcus thailandensis JCM 13552 TaxID=1227457 RepID=M0MU73_9EURY|nr:hypothetical protein [Halococcus thailandensis]EMA48878.1 hypothetical protein C451_19748 [Halococcus thailandensis JCM 13552]